MCHANLRRERRSFVAVFTLESSNLLEDLIGMSFAQARPVDACLDAVRVRVVMVDRLCVAHSSENAFVTGGFGGGVGAAGVFAASREILGDIVGESLRMFRNQGTPPCLQTVDVSEDSTLTGRTVNRNPRGAFEGPPRSRTRQ